MNKNIKITDALWAEKLNLLTDKVLIHQWKALNNEFLSVEKSNAIRNLKISAGLLPKQEIIHNDFPKDSDLGKWIEGASYSLNFKFNDELVEKLDEVANLMEMAQLPDGYLNTFYQCTNINDRFSSVSEMHELYCAGHLLEGAIAYYQATQKDKMLKVMIKYVDYLMTIFGKDKQYKACPGHQELELALVKLYELTKDKKYLDFSAYFIYERGKTPNYFDNESTFRKNSKFFSYEYYQAHKPLLEQTEAVGHAVRALYLYCGATDIAINLGDNELFTALKKLWDNVTTKKMYITGGVGSQAISECFTLDYDLPPDTAYCETCASIALSLWARRMLMLEKSSKYAEVMEKALYNTVLSGMSSDGTKYFYVNPLEVDSKKADFRADLEHIKTERVSWFGCACCPPNVARTIASIGDFIYTETKSEIYLNLYISNEFEMDGGGSLKMSSNLPFNKKVQIQLQNITKKLCLRIPSWVDGFNIDCNYLDLGNGYIKVLDSKQVIEIEFEVKPKIIYPNPKISSISNKVAVSFGQYIYCVESVDNGSNLASLLIDKSSEIITYIDKESSLIFLKAKAKRLLDNTDNLYSSVRPKFIEVDLILTPYYYWNNRGKGEMLVWLNN